MLFSRDRGLIETQESFFEVRTSQKSLELSGGRSLLFSQQAVNYIWNITLQGNLQKKEMPLLLRQR